MPSIQCVPRGKTEMGVGGRGRAGDGGPQGGRAAGTPVYLEEREEGRLFSTTQMCFEGGSAVGYLGHTWQE